MSQKSITASEVPLKPSRPHPPTPALFNFLVLQVFPKDKWRMYYFVPMYCISKHYLQNSTNFILFTLSATFSVHISVSTCFWDSQISNIIRIIFLTAFWIRTEIHVFLSSVIYLGSLCFLQQRLLSCTRKTFHAPNEIWSPSAVRVKIPVGFLYLPENLSRKTYTPWVH